MLVGAGRGLQPRLNRLDALKVYEKWVAGLQAASRLGRTN